MTTQPEALRLADAIEQRDYELKLADVVAELRRLSAENEALRDKNNQLHTEINTAWQEVKTEQRLSFRTQVEAYEALLRQALLMLESGAVFYDTDPTITAIRAALAEPDHIPDATKMAAEALATPGKPMPEPFGYFKVEPFGWTDCAETDDGAKPLFDWDTVQDLLQQIEALEDGDALLRKMDVICHHQERYSGGYDEILRHALRDVETLQAAIRKLHAAKGRYHTQLAACDLFDLVGLPNERPKK